MARILMGSYMVRYPLGGMLSWGLQYLLGFHRLGHDVYLVERATGPNECFDPDISEMTDDASFGLRAVDELFERVGMKDRLAFIDCHDECFGMSKRRIKELFQTADLFVDGGTHGAWLDWVSDATRTVLIDGEPGFTQTKWLNHQPEGMVFPDYDLLFTNGLLLGTEHCLAPTLDREWIPLVNPVVPELFEVTPARLDSAYTTVMNWSSHGRVEFQGEFYGQKDVEFERFIGMPLQTDATLEVAISGRFPADRLRDSGWTIRNAHEVTRSFDSYRSYIAESRGEMSVCKNVFVGMQSGWFSDRSAAYLASGRPVILQDTGFGKCLPTGEGLFAAADADAAVAAIDSIESDFARHSRRAREIAMDCLSAEIVLQNVIDAVG